MRDFIRHIVADTEAHYTPDHYWPMHPRDLDAGDDPAQRCTPLYYGACGVIWACTTCKTSARRGLRAAMTKRSTPC